MSLSKTVFFFSILTVFFCGDVNAEDTSAGNGDNKSENTAYVEEPGNVSQQSQVFKDPETGEFITREEALKRGIIEEMESLIFVPDSVQEEIAVEPLENGGFKAELPATYNHKINAAIDENGVMSSTCNHK